MTMTMTTTLALSSISSSAAASSSKINVVPGNIPVPGLKNGMDYCKLGDSDLVVSKVCMGTMTVRSQLACFAQCCIYFVAFSTSHGI